MESTFQRCLNAIQAVLAVLWVNIVCFAYGFMGLLKGKGSGYGICKIVTDMFKPKISVSKSSKPIRPGKTMFLANHRSWTDFFLDGYMTGGSSYLSRYAVIVGVPGPCFCGYLNNFVWFFNRKPGINRNWFTEFFKRKWSVRPDNGCVVYPEGHRYKEAGTLPLKTGVLEVAYNMNIPCQCVIANGKEDLLDEINFRVKRGQKITYCVSEVMDPSKFDNKEDWFKHVRSVWEKTVNTLNKEKEVTEVDQMLPGVDSEKCRDEPILPKHAMWVWSVILVLCVIVFNLW